ncbi:T9SS type A sorting domain-containing protein [Aequorivita viscosa]|nr:T9SS type A sorting domain-containing protein [Aequorivita viscosa]
MVKYIFVAAFLLVVCTGRGQFGSQRIIYMDTGLVTSALAADLDGDGDLDIVSGSRTGPYNIAWFENLDGLGNFGTEIIVENNLFDEVYSIFLADLDGDGDMDILTTAFSLDKIIWYENLDGQGNFSGQKIISNTADGAFTVVSGDLDGDGDMDVISGSDFSGLAWYENLDGQGDFFMHLIDNNVSGTRSVIAIDVDGDGDMDIVGNSNAPNKTYWIENMDGLGTFGAPNSIYEMGQYVTNLIAADVDGDGDTDVLTVSFGDNEVAWFENLDGFGNFGPKNTISNILDKALEVFAADLDNDGDIDVLTSSGGTFDGEIAWFENLDSAGNFSVKISINTVLQFPRSVIAADLDNDGDMDVISSSQNDHKVAWYENLTIMGISENVNPVVNIYPNPTDGLLYIDSNTESIIGATVFDILGKKVFQVEGNIQQLDISNLQNGMYFFKITTNTGSFAQKIIKE